MMSDRNRIWTAGFLNERFSEPVSPLGWTLIRESLETLALREPLRYLGVSWEKDRPLTRLYRGHPYTDAEAFWSLYKLFPDFILPEDAERYFPNERIEIRKQVPRPTGLWDPRVWWAVGRSMLSDWVNWSSWHNWRIWRAFESNFTGELSVLHNRFESLQKDGLRCDPGDAWNLLKDIQKLNRRLLSYHRWSLTHAELTYTLLRRLLAHWFDEERATHWSASLVTGVPNLSLKVDRDLAELAAAWRNKIPTFKDTWQEFLAQHGHRSFSLDIYHSPYAEATETVQGLLSTAPPYSNGSRDKPDDWKTIRQDVESKLPGPARRIKIAMLRHLVDLARIYMGLREDQRYRWQQTLALMRQIVVTLGRQWTEKHVLAYPDNIFFVTWEELANGISDTATLPGITEIDARQKEFETLRKQYADNPAAHYPPFLKGNVPWSPSKPAGQPGQPETYRGKPASPGQARGPVIRITDARQLEEVTEGSILVARSTDPAWTPVFGRIAALVTETGGLLSHGSVVAREYGLPAVVGVDGIFEKLDEGQIIEVDGTKGQVTAFPMNDFGKY